MSDAPTEPEGKEGRKPRRQLSPLEYDRIGQMWAMGKSYRRIARQYDVDEATIRRVLRDHIWPSVKMSPSRSIEAELLKLSVVEAKAWECFMSDAPAETREQIKQELNEAGDKGNPSKKVVDLVTKTSVFKSKQTAYLDVVLRCIEMRCRLEGHFAPKRIRIETDDEHRVAGTTPDRIVSERMIQLRKALEDRLNYEAQVRGEAIEGRLLSVHETNGDQ